MRQKKTKKRKYTRRAKHKPGCGRLIVVRNGAEVWIAGECRTLAAMSDLMGHAGQTVLDVSPSTPSTQGEAF